MREGKLGGKIGRSDDKGGGAAMFGYTRIKYLLRSSCNRTALLHCDQRATYFYCSTAFMKTSIKILL